MLAQLEKLSGNEGAWVDHAGKYLRVRGEADYDAFFAKQKFKIKPIDAPKVERWYSSSETIFLSAEEAGVLARRRADAASKSLSLSESDTNRLRDTLEREMKALFDKYKTVPPENWREEWDGMLGRVVEDAFPAWSPEKKRQLTGALLERQ